MTPDQVENTISALQNILKEITTSNQTDFSLTIISVAINAVLAIVVGVQLWYFRHEINSRLRPWIGGGKSKVGIEYKEQTKELVYHYTNYGQLPARSLTERWNISDKINAREQVIKNVKGDNTKSINFPTQERGFSLHISDNPIVENAIKQKKSFYVEIVIDYEFGKNNIAHFCVIAEIAISANNMQIIDEWTQ